MVFPHNVPHMIATEDQRLVIRQSSPRQVHQGSAVLSVHGKDTGSWTNDELRETVCFVISLGAYIIVTGVVLNQFPIPSRQRHVQNA